MSNQCTDVAVYNRFEVSTCLQLNQLYLNSATERFKVFSFKPVKKKFYKVKKNAKYIYSSYDSITHDPKLKMIDRAEMSKELKQNLQYFIFACEDEVTIQEKNVRGKYVNKKLIHLIAPIINQNSKVTSVYRNANTITSDYMWMEIDNLEEVEEWDACRALISLKNFVQIEDPVTGYIEDSILVFSYGFGSDTQYKTIKLKNAENNSEDNDPEKVLLWAIIKTGNAEILNAFYTIFNPKVMEEIISHMLVTKEKKIKPEDQAEEIKVESKDVTDETDS